MIKKFISIALSAVLIMTTAGCGSKVVDYNADDEDLNAASDDGTLKSKYGIPEKCEEELNVNGSGVRSITISDTDVTYPETSTMDIAYYKKKDITNKEKQEIAETIFDEDEGIYLYDWEGVTKSKIENQIYEMEKMIQSYSLNGDNESVSSLETELDDLYTRLESAPDNLDEAGDYSADDFTGTIDGRCYELLFSDTDIILTMDENYEVYRPIESDIETFCYIRSYDMMWDDGVDIEGIENVCSINESQAQDIAEEFMQELGMDDMVLSESGGLFWRYFDYCDDYEFAALEMDGYVFTYSRSVGNVPVSQMEVYNLQNLPIDEVDIPPEKITISVDENGVLEAEWSIYMDPTGEVDEDVELLSFDEMIEAANENVAAYYAEYSPGCYDVNFNKIELTYYLSETKDAGVFKYTPVWILSEYETYGDHTTEKMPEQAVIINATDGQVIDLVSLSQALGT